MKSLNSSNSLNILLKASWEATRGQRVRLFGFVGLFIIAYSIDLLVPWAIGYVLEVFVERGFTPEAYELALYGLAAYVGLRLLNTLFHHLARYIQNIVAFSARMHEMRKLFNAFMSFPLRWHINHHSGENLSRLHRAVGAVDGMIGTFIWQVVEGLVKIVFATAALFALDLYVALNVLGMGCVTILVMILFNSRLRTQIRSNNAFYDRLNRICVDYLFNIITVKTLRIEDSAKRYLERQQPVGLGISKTISKYQELKWGSVGIGYALVLGSSLAIYFWGQADVGGAIDVAKVYVLMNYLDRIFGAISAFTGYYGAIVEASTAYEDASRILSELPRSQETAGISRLGSAWTTLKIKDLNFTYPDSHNPGVHLNELVVNNADKIALVGPSGGGKSTLLKVLAGMLPANAREIQVDSTAGITLDDIAAESLLLPQEPEIFSETVRYNLSMGEDLAESDLHFAIALCKVDQVISKLPQGWESDLAENGLNLSVGEKQRVAMARGLLRASGKQIILLDEPTSSLDPMTEKSIFQGLLQHFENRTVITACHRLALVPLFDKIIFVADGRVQESGTFDQLVAAGGAFARAWSDYQKKVVREHGQTL